MIVIVSYELLNNLQFNNVCKLIKINVLISTGKKFPLGNLEFHPLARLNRVSSGSNSMEIHNPALADIMMASKAPGIHDEKTEVEETDAITGKVTSRSFLVPSFQVSKLFEVDGCRGIGENCNIHT